MIPGVKNWIFKKGMNWAMLFRFKDKDLTAADVKIIIKHVTGTVAFDSSDTATFVSGGSGVFSKTLDGDDTLVLFDVSYLKTGTVALNEAYEYDVEITESGSRNVWIQGKINVTRNI